MISMNVMIASPSYDGKVDVRHAISLVETAKIGLANNINILPLYVSFDAMLQRARNDICKLFLQSNAEFLLFIDADQDWNPMDAFKLIGHNVPIVAAPVMKKSVNPMYNVKLYGDYIVNDNGLVKVDGVGTGMMCIRRDAMDALWNSSDIYSDKADEYSRNIFEIKIINGNLYSEDMVFCEKWKAIGGTIFIDPTIDCGHNGPKRWEGNFSEWIKLVKDIN